MSKRTAQYVASRLKRQAVKVERDTRAMRRKPRPLGEKEQMRRFLSGTYRQMLIDGQIDGEQYTKMAKAMGKKLGVV